MFMFLIIMKRDGFLIIGMILLIWSLVDITNTIINKSWYQLTWFSNNIILILSLAFLFRSKIFMTAVAISSLMVESPWFIDFFGRLLFNFAPFGGLSDYMFNELGFKNWVFYLELDHLLIIPLSIYGMLKLGVHKRAYLICGIFIFYFNSLAYFFTPKELNINCISRLCFLKENFIKVNSFSYYIIWMVSLGIVVYLLNKLIYYIGRKYFKKVNVND